MNDFEDEINKRLSLNRENKALQDAKLFFKRVYFAKVLL